MLYDDNDREIIRALSWDEMKARIPTQAAKFFTLHHPLLVAYKYSLLGEATLQSETTQEYFIQMPPDQQYGLVIEMGAMTLALAQADLAAKAVVNMMKSSRATDMIRFSYHGVNIHLTRASIELLIRALKDQSNALTVQMNALNEAIQSNPNALETKKLYSILSEERKSNSKTLEELKEQIHRIYPNIES